LQVRQVGDHSTHRQGVADRRLEHAAPDNRKTPLREHVTSHGKEDDEADDRRCGRPPGE